MNILLTNFHPGYCGGHASYIETLLLAQEHIDVNFYVACPSSSQLFQNLKHANFNNLIALDFPGKLKDYKLIASNLRKMNKLISKHNIHIVHTNGSSDNRMALYCKWLLRSNIRIVHTRHHSHLIKNAISKFRLLNMNDAVIFVSASVFHTLNIPVNTKNIFLIKNGIDLTRWNMRKNKESKDKSSINLASIAGTADYKCWHHLILALKALSEKKRQRFTVTIAGSKPDLTKIEKLCGRDYPAHLVTFADFTDKPEHLLADVDADIGFVLSDSVETISFACREMMAAGLPVIGSNFGGIAENITDREDGWVVPTGDIAALSTILGDIADMSHNRLEKMKASARLKASKEFSRDKMIEQTCKVYRLVAGQ